MGGTFTSLLIIVETVLTAAAVVMFLYRSMLDMKEEDQLILDDAESHLAREQATIRHKVTILSTYLKFIGRGWRRCGPRRPRRPPYSRRRRHRARRLATAPPARAARRQRPPGTRRGEQRP